MTSAAVKLALVVGIVIGVIAVTIAVYSPMLAATQPLPDVIGDSAETHVNLQLPDDGEVQLVIDRPAIWKHEQSRDFDNDSFTIKMAKTLPTSSISSYSIVPFNASIHVTNHYISDYVTVDQWQNFTNANDWVTATFEGLDDGDTLFVTVYENDTPVLNFAESGRS